MTTNTERIPTRLIRWLWEHENADGTITAGWTMTRRGATREIRKASAANGERHAQPTVAWTHDRQAR